MDEKPSDEPVPPNMRGSEASPAKPEQRPSTAEGERCAVPHEAWPNTPTVPQREADEPMSNLHVHAPAERVHGWRDFFVHIAVVAIGLLLALGLERVAERVHDNQERAELLEAMNHSFEIDSAILAERERALLTFESYVSDLIAAVAARSEGKTSKLPDPETDPRNQTFVPPPNFGPYDAAKANGSLALLDLRTTRIYARIDFQHTLMRANFERFFFQLGAVRAFSRRQTVRSFDDRSRLPGVDIDRLTPQQLDEYLRLLAELDEGTLAYAGQLRRLRVAYRAILDGAQDDSAILKAVGDASRGGAADRADGR